jgi:uncharacterized membrane protein
MTLPDISLPQALLDMLPADLLPVLAHPPVVHFAIVLPVMVVLLELANMIAKSGGSHEQSKGRTVSSFSFFIVIVMVGVYIAAYVTGSVDGKAAWDTLSQAGQDELKGHKLLGTYLVYGSVVLLLFKLIAMVSGAKGRLLFFVLALLFVAGALKQGEEGGELVYEHGANVEIVKAMDDKLFDLEDELDTCKSECGHSSDADDSTDAVQDGEMPEEVPAVDSEASDDDGGPMIEVVEGETVEISSQEENSTI